MLNFKVIMATQIKGDPNQNDMMTEKVMTTMRKKIVMITGCTFVLYSEYFMYLIYMLYAKPAKDTPLTSSTFSTKQMY